MRSWDGECIILEMNDWVRYGTGQGLGLGLGLGLEGLVNDTRTYYSTLTQNIEMANSYLLETEKWSAIMRLPLHTALLPFYFSFKPSHSRQGEFVTPRCVHRSRYALGIDAILIMPAIA